MTRNYPPKRPAEQGQTEETKPCLMCGNDFVSDGPHNRVCKRCKGTQVWREGGTDMESAA